MSGKGIQMLLKACKLNWYKVVRNLLKIFPVCPKILDNAAMICIMSNSIESFKELIECGKVDWNMVNEKTGKTPVTCAVHYHRVEMVQALSKVEGVKWTGSTPFDAIISLKKSCHHIMKILKDIPDLEINVNDGKGYTALEYAFIKRDIKSIMILFSLPQLDIKVHNIHQVVQDMKDLDTLINECHKAYRETGMNYSDVVDYLTEIKKILLAALSRERRVKKGRKKNGRGC